MITFKISFLLAFAIKTETVNKKKGNKTDKKVLNKKKVNKSSAQDIIDETPKYAFKTEKIIGTAHIEYELVPNKVKYYVDVICYGSSAKIFTYDSQKNLKTIITNDKIWVPICLEHYVETLKLEEIKALHEYVIELNVFTNINKLGSLAKADKTKILYAYDDQATSSDFVEIYDEDPNLKQTSMISQEETIQENTSFKPNTVGNDGACLHIPEKIDTVYEIIRNDSLGIKTECKDFVLPHIKKDVAVKIETERTKQGKNKKEKGKKESGAKTKRNKSENTKEEILKIQISGEIFFTDPQLAIYKTKNKNRIIKDVFVILSVNQLLTRSQKLMLNSLVIKIKKLSNVPVEILKDKGISSVYVAYDVPYIENCKSIEKPLDDTINFNESHIYFNNSGSKIKLIEFIQTQKLFVEVYGVRENMADTSVAQLFGKNNNDENISQIVNVYHSDAKEEKLKSPVLLAVCTFDISSLMRNIWDFKEKSQCHSLGLTLFQKCLGFYDNITYTDLKTINEININSGQFKGKNLLDEGTLLTFGTSLQLEVYLMAPQAASLILHQIPSTFKRILFFSYLEDFAKNVLNEILKHNNYLHSELKIVQSAEKDKSEVTDIITGFMVDNGTSFIFFIEGPSTGFILNIWHLLDNCSEEVGKILFNTDMAFEKRLYNHFLDKGLYIISLKLPLHDILANHKLYMAGSVPVPCMEALKKFGLMLYSSTYKSIFQYNLLPKPQELMSMDTEWGVPFRWMELKDTLKRNVFNTYSQVVLNIDNKN